MDLNLTPEEVKDLFGEHDPRHYQTEVEQRWGDTDAYKISHRRTSAYTKREWTRLRAQGEANELAFLQAMQSGLPPESAEARDAAEHHRLHIDTWFYPCSYEMQSGLAEMYVADERFTEHYDKRAAGLAAYIRDAIIANARPHLPR